MSSGAFGRPTLGERPRATPWPTATTRTTARTKESSTPIFPAALPTSSPGTPTPRWLPFTRAVAASRRSTSSTPRAAATGICRPTTAPVIRGSLAGWNSRSPASTTPFSTWGPATITRRWRRRPCRSPRPPACPAGSRTRAPARSPCPLRAARIRRSSSSPRRPRSGG